ncbi:peptidoglycan-binding protein [Hamadaea sp. NPDC051192]|uniref:peptidoglycan-binding protein n=1 Tax=Hamadaea sp. NPDC051192 TaxID=3154940 RepID=UPI00341E6C3B
MGNRTKRVLLAVTSAVAIAASLTIAAPAQANTSEGFIAGAGAIKNDFGDEGVLSSSSHRFSGATLLWQWILWADGTKESDGTTFDVADVDCDFGPNTTATTRNWQRDHGVGVDGVVGTETFGRADDQLEAPLGDSVGNAQYHGKVHVLYLMRDFDSSTYHNGYVILNQTGGQGSWRAYYNSAPDYC